MANIPGKVEERLATALKRFQPVVSSAKSRDVNESDTAIIVTDILCEVFGYDKYSEITSEHAIRGTFCDLALTVESKLHFLVEMKAAGLELKDQHVKQVVDYAANKGVDWVILTNATTWRVYRVTFGKPINHDLVFEFDLLTLNHKNKDDLALLFLISREAISKHVLGEFHEQRQALSRFTIAATLLSDAVVTVVRRELKRLCPDVKINCEEISDVLVREVVKREVLEGDKFEEAKRKVAKAAGRALKAKKDTDETADQPQAPVITSAVMPATRIASQPAAPPTASA